VERGKPLKLATQTLVGAWDSWKTNNLSWLETVDRWLSKEVRP